MDLLSIVGGAVDLFGSLFGGGNKGSYDSSGVFTPGDMSNRQRQAAQMINQRGLTALVDQQKVDMILRGQGIWQNNLGIYLDEVANSPKVSANPINKISDQVSLMTGGISPVVLLGGAVALYFAFKK